MGDKEYSRFMDAPDRAHQQNEQFLRTYFKPYGTQERDFEFRWHGLIGNTKSGLRLIGPDTNNPILFYNL